MPLATDATAGSGLGGGGGGGGSSGSVREFGFSPEGFCVEFSLGLSDFGSLPSGLSDLGFSPP
ncbi:MAG TPA: hypothetical protein PKA58_35250, partial [Polyangium sp.]|nr:hypothetical protein [Polyangium sp.]